MIDPARAFPHRRPLADPALRLICLPYAGAGASIYRDWPAAMPDGAEVCAFEPPGHETRFKEPLVEHFEPMVEMVSNAIRMLGRRPYAIVGYSLGAMIAAESAQRLGQLGFRPELLILCGCASPASPASRRLLGDLDEDAFVEAVRRYGGLSEAVLNEPELLEVFAPILRADCRVAESWRAVSRSRFQTPLSTPLFVIGGRDDAFVSRAELEGWAAITTARTEVVQVEGGHFFMDEALKAARPRVAALVEAEPVSSPRG